MKRVFLTIALFVICFTLSNTAYSQAFAVGIVDVEAIVKEMPEAQAADKELIDLSKKYQDTIIEWRNSLETKYQNYEKQKGMMAQNKQQEELEKLQKEAQDLQNFSRIKEDEVGRRREELLEPIRVKVKNAIDDVAKAEKLSMVLAKDNASVVMYFDPKHEITFRVIDKIKRGK